MLLDLYGDVDLGDPLADHPLNDGRVLWLLGVPPLDGSQVWYDLCQQVGGTLVNGPTWTPTGRGDAGLTFNGSTQVVTVPDATSLRPASVSVAVWFRLSSTPSSSCVISKPFNGPSWSSPYLSWMIRITSLATMEFAVGNGTVYTSSGPPTTASVSLSVGTWYRVVLTYDQTTCRGYLNGASVFAATTVSGAIGYGATPVIVGGDYGSSPYADYFPGTVSDPSIWSRAVSAAEVQADYEQSLTGYPDVLRRHRRATWMLAGGGGASFNPAWAYRSTVVLGGAF